MLVTRWTYQRAIANPAASLARDQSNVAIATESFPLPTGLESSEPLNIPPRTPLGRVSASTEQRFPSAISFQPNLGAQAIFVSPALRMHVSQAGIASAPLEQPRTHLGLLNGSERSQLAIASTNLATSPFVIHRVNRTHSETHAPDPAWAKLQILDPSNTRKIGLKNR